MSDAPGSQEDATETLHEVIAALRFQRWNGADAVDRAWASPLSAAPVPLAPPRAVSAASLAKPVQSLPNPAPAVVRTAPAQAPFQPRVLPPVPRPEAARVLPPVAPPRTVRPSATQADAALHALRETIGACQLCGHASARTQIVHGSGNPAARLFLVGGAPGAAEDAAGQPWQGEAGQLLDKMLGAMGLFRNDVWMTSLVLCKPPGEDMPRREAIQACAPWLRQQGSIVQPEVILAFGELAARTLLRNPAPLGELRGRWHPMAASQLMATWAPEEAVRTPALKRDIWADLQLVMARLGLKRPG